MAACYDSNSSKRASECTQKLAQTLQFSDEIVSNHLQEAGNRMNRCVNSCKDEVTEKTFAIRDVDNDRAQLTFLTCASKCADKYSAYLKSSIKTTEQQIEKLKR